MSVILASGSPRRAQLLRQLGLNDFIIRPADADENIPRGLSPEEAVVVLSERKASAAAERAASDDIIIAADTAVAVDGLILGKPEDEADAVRLLELLSGRSHRVFTGMTIQKGEERLSSCSNATVFFRPLTNRQIRAYVASGESMDKAGGYGIQGRGAFLAERIEGDYTCIVGLSLPRLYDMLINFGVDLFA